MLSGVDGGRAHSARGRGYRGEVADEQWAGVGPAGGTQTANGRVVSSYPGEKFGLPESGPRSVPGMGRRFGALFVDWILCAFIASALLHSQYWALAIFAAETYILTVLPGTTIGKRLFGLRVARLDGRPVGAGWGLVRTLLLLAVVPPLVYDRDRRGLHDKAANTIVVRM